MYKKSDIRAILIVKTSSLGDIIQSFPVLDYLRARFPPVVIDWVVKGSLVDIVAGHPFVRHAIPLGDWKRLRQEKYDVVFDLQKNTKSGIVTALSRAKVKVGFGWQSVREWPNVLFTNCRFEVPKDINIRLQYVRLVQRYFDDQTEVLGQKAPRKTGKKIMVCPGSKWVNKQLPVETWIEVLKKISGNFYLMWGSEAEKAMCEEITRQVGHSMVVDKLSLTDWQTLMGEMDLVIAVDSSALHLAGYVNTPTFSVFGPTRPEIFKPLGDHHLAIQGTCPYAMRFEKQCPALRTCKTGACMKNFSAEQIVQSLLQFFDAAGQRG